MTLKAAAGKRNTLKRAESSSQLNSGKWNYALNTRKSQHDKYNFAVTVILPKISL